MYSVRYRPQAAISALRCGIVARFSIKRKVMAYPPHGSAQKERIRFALYCVAVLLRRFLYQRAEGCSAIWRKAEKGEAFAIPRWFIQP